MVTLPVDETIPTSSVRCPGERRHALSHSGDCDKAPKRLAGIGIEPRNLATVVNGVGLTGHSVRDIKRGEHACVIEKSLTRETRSDVGLHDLAAVVDAKGSKGSEVQKRHLVGALNDGEHASVIEKYLSLMILIDVGPNNLAAIVDAVGFGRKHTGDLDGGDPALVREKAIRRTAAAVVPHDLALIVDPLGNGKDCTWDINRGEHTIGIEEAASNRIGNLIVPYDLAAIVEAQGKGVECARDAEDGEDTVLIQKPMSRLGGGVSVSSA
jgi:hypothetical protein